MRLTMEPPPRRPSRRNIHDSINTRTAKSRKTNSKHCQRLFTLDSVPSSSSAAMIGRLQAPAIPAPIQPRRQPILNPCCDSSQTGLQLGLILQEMKLDQVRCLAAGQYALFLGIFFFFLFVFFSFSLFAWTLSEGESRPDQLQRMVNEGR